jgi:hypothetical protein
MRKCRFPALTCWAKRYRPLRGLDHMTADRRCLSPVPGLTVPCPLFPVAPPRFCGPPSPVLLSPVPCSLLPLPGFAVPCPRLPLSVPRSRFPVRGWPTQPLSLKVVGCPTQARLWLGWVNDSQNRSRARKFLGIPAPMLFQRLNFRRALGTQTQAGLWSKTLAASVIL